MLGKAKALMELKKIQSQLAKEVVEVEAGDGAVKVQISGEQKIKSVSLDEDLIRDASTQQLERWIESAVTQAISKSQQIAAAKMQEMSGGLGIPGL